MNSNQWRIDYDRPTTYVRVTHMASGESMRSEANSTTMHKVEDELRRQIAIRLDNLIK